MGLKLFLAICADMWLLSLLEVEGAVNKVVSLLGFLAGSVWFLLPIFWLAVVWLALLVVWLVLAVLPLAAILSRGTSE